MTRRTWLERLGRARGRGTAGTRRTHASGIIPSADAMSWPSLMNVVPSDSKVGRSAARQVRLRGGVDAAPAVPDRPRDDTCRQPTDDQRAAGRWEPAAADEIGDLSGGVGAELDESRSPRHALRIDDPRRIIAEGADVCVRGEVLGHGAPGFGGSVRMRWLGRSSRGRRAGRTPRRTARRARSIRGRSIDSSPRSSPHGARRRRRAAEGRPRRCRGAGRM